VVFFIVLAVLGVLVGIWLFRRVSGEAPVTTVQRKRISHVSRTPVKSRSRGF